jgi:hypothetical protein
VGRMAAPRKSTSFTSITVNKRAPPRTIPVPTHPTRLVLLVQLGITASVNTPLVLNEGRNNLIRALVNDLEFPLHCRPGVIPSRPFALTLCLYHSTSVCNSFPGYSKVLCHLACLALHRQHVKKEMHGKPGARAQAPSMGLNKIDMITRRPEEARERVFHGPRKR